MTELERRYRARLAELQRRVRARLARLYADTIDPADLDASFETFTPQAAALVRAGQSGGVTLASGYLSALVTLSAARSATFPGLTGAVGTLESLVDGMAAFSPMVKAQIGKGVPVPQAVDYGRYLAERFADNELTGAVDRHTEAVTRDSGEFSGWTGITVGETCDPCRGNEGFHALEQPFYRHPGCDCTREYLVAV